LGRTGALNLLAEAQGRFGQTSSSKNSLLLVRDSVAQVDDVESKVSAMAKMSLTYGLYLDNPRAARSYLEQAESLLGGADNPGARVRGSVLLAYANHRLESSDESSRLIDQAKTSAATIEDARRRTDAVVEVAAALHKMGMANESLAAFNDAHQTASSIDDNVSKAHALAEIGIKLAAANHNSLAGTLLDEAESVADSIGDRGLQREVMDKINGGRAAL
jgi:hypothetical protein